MHFSVTESCELQAGLYGVEKKMNNNLILKMVALENKANSYSEAYQRHEKKIVDCKAIVHQPQFDFRRTNSWCRCGIKK